MFNNIERITTTTTTTTTSTTKKMLRQTTKVPRSFRWQWFCSSITLSMMIMIIIQNQSKLSQALPLNTIDDATTQQNHPFCQSTAQIQHAYNIGPDVYLVLNSKSIYRYDVGQRQLSPKKLDLPKLFGKDKFKWVDTVISLKGVCQNSSTIKDLCDQSSDLDRLHLVIGSKILKNRDKSYGMAVYELDSNDQFKLIENLSSRNLLEKLAKIGLVINPSEMEGSVMMGQFWPNQNGNSYYRSGLFVPFNNQLFFSFYFTNQPLETQNILHRKLAIEIDSITRSSWIDSNPELKAGKTFKAMFHVGDRDAFGLTMENELMKFVWHDDDQQVTFEKMNSLRELLNCYKNSSEKKGGETTLAPSTTGNTETSTLSSSYRTTTTIITSTIASTVKQVNNHDEIMIVPSSTDLPNHHNQHKQSSTSLASIRENQDDIENTNDGNDIIHDHNKEEESNPNDIIDDQLQDEPIKGQNSDNGHLQKQRETRPHLAEASARGPFKSEDGLLWTFAILMSILIILAIMILIPILIIRNKSRTNRMCLNKKQKNGSFKSVQKHYQNGNGNAMDGTNSEEVQLMNSSPLEK